MALSDYEDALKSFIHDDDKLVTYKWLSKELEIHVNVAKAILKKYWEKYKNKDKIEATLLLIGQLKDESFRVMVVKESELDSAKEKFAKITCEHLYSIQKTLPDIELLTLVGEGDLRYSAIKCNDDYIRNEDEIESLRYIGNVRKEKNKPIKTPTITNRTDENPISKIDELSPTEKSKKQTDKKDETKEKEKSLAKDKTDKEEIQEKKKSPTNKSSNLKPGNKTSKKPIQSKQSGFDHLFGKVPSKPPTEPNKPEDSEKDTQNNSLNINEKNEKSLSKETDTKINREKVKSNKIKDHERHQDREKKETQEKENRQSQVEEKSRKVVHNVDKTEKSKAKAKPEARGKKRNRSQEKNTLSKRKRIVVLDSSEDECEKSDNDEEQMEIEEEPPKVVRTRSPSPPAEKRENGKRMVRKTIDKTFKDEEGFLVTKRVHVYEAVSDNEESEVKEKRTSEAKTNGSSSKKETNNIDEFF